MLAYATCCSSTKHSWKKGIQTPSSLVRKKFKIHKEAKAVISAMEANSKEQSSDSPVIKDLDAHPSTSKNPLVNSSSKKKSDYRNKIYPIQMNIYSKQLFQKIPTTCWLTTTTACWLNILSLLLTSRRWQVFTMISFAH